MYVSLFLLFMLGICLYTDLKRRIIPNIVTLTTFLAGIGVNGYHLLQTDGMNGLILLLVSLIIGVIICEKLLVRKKYWAYGDAKLFLATAVWFPPFVGLFAILGLYIFLHFGYALIYRLMKRWNLTLLPAKFPGSILITAAVVISLVTL